MKHPLIMKMNAETAVVDAAREATKLWNHDSGSGWDDFVSAMETLRKAVNASDAIPVPDAD